MNEHQELTFIVACIGCALSLAAIALAVIL